MKYLYFFFIFNFCKGVRIRQKINNGTIISCNNNTDAFNGFGDKWDNINLAEKQAQHDMRYCYEFITLCTEQCFNEKGQVNLTIYIYIFFISIYI